MIKKIMGLILVVLFAATMAFAQDEKAKDDAEYSIKFDGKMYLWFASEVYSAGKEKNGFELARAYVGFKAKLGKYFSARVLADVNTIGYEYFYVKNAYLQFEHAFGPVTLWAQTGIIGNPINSSNAKMMDLRWITNNKTTDKTADLIGYGIDSTADIGATLGIKIMKYVEFIYALTHGEGYKNISTDMGGARHNAIVKITPWKHIFVHGYGSYYDRQKKQAWTYFGAGAGWVAPYLKAGMNFTYAIQNENRTHTMFEIFAHLDLETWTNYGFLIIGRFGYGMSDVTGMDDPTMYMAGGLGYKFNKYVRIAAYYEVLDNQATGINATGQNEAKFSLKAEAKY